MIRTDLHAPKKNLPRFQAFSLRSPCVFLVGRRRRLGSTSMRVEAGETFPPTMREGEAKFGPL
jgi:hypothetical protein